MAKTAGLGACLWLCGTLSAWAAPEGVYRGPGYFAGYYGGYLYGYNPGPSLPLPGDETIICAKIFIADRYIWRGGNFVSSPIVNRACRAIRGSERRFEPELVLKR